MEDNNTVNPSNGHVDTQELTNLLAAESQLEVDNIRCLMMRFVEMYALSTPGLTILMPEQDRLDFQHKLFTLLLNGILYIAPIPDKPRHVLDVATGTGIWAIEFASAHPESNLLGTDLSPIQPAHAPPNLKFEIYDAEDEWDFTTPFDFIHMRAVVSCSKHPRSVFAPAFKALAPGGYLQLRDPLFPFLYHDPPPEDCALKRWNDLILEAGTKLGRKWTNAHNYRQWVEELGFEDVVEIRERLPLSPWAKGKRTKYLSLWLQHDMLSGIDGMSRVLFTRALGWQAEEVQNFLVAVKKDIQDTSLHAYSEGVIVDGRKPFEVRNEEWKDSTEPLLTHGMEP